MKDFLLVFDDGAGQFVSIASNVVFEDLNHPDARKMAVDAFKRGLVKVSGSDEPVVDSDAVFWQELTLTEAGRAFCGLPPLVPKKKPMKKACFDFGEDE